MTKEELNIYFKSPKNEQNGWYEINSKGENIWDKNKLNDFWGKIENYKINQGDYNFSFYEFPKFIKTSFRLNNGFCFKKEVYFEHCIFRSRAKFERIRFDKNVFFSKTTFMGSADFELSEFKEEAFFLFTKFNGHAHFRNSKFKLGYFMLSKFNYFASFQGAKFYEKGEFYGAQFNYFSNFDTAEFKKADFRNTLFKEEVDYSHTVFSEVVNFSNINSNSEPPELIFQDINSSSNISFSNTNLSNIRLTNSDISKICFDRCIWKINNRIHLVNEKENFFDAENHYRQLKINFDNTKDWTMSGYAYISEMEMRKHILLKKNKVKWFVYWYYGFFGGYTQNYIKPLKSITILFLLFSLIFFFCDYNLIKSFERSIYGTLPFLIPNPETPIEGYWLLALNFQKFISGTFLTFFILGLRKQFKQ